MTVTVLRVQLLTALDGMGGHLERDVLSSWLRYMHTKHQADSGVFPTHVCLALPQLNVGVSELQDPGAVNSVGRREQREPKGEQGMKFKQEKKSIDTNAHAHCFHVVLWLQGDLQDFGAVDDLLIAGCRHGFTSDAVHLIKGVGLQDALISRTNEDLQTERVLASVAM